MNDQTGDPGGGDVKIEAGNHGDHLAGPVHLSPEDHRRLRELRRGRAVRHPVRRLPLGGRLADRVAEVVGSWRFIMIQSTLLAIWIALNVTAYVLHWDPYPFILLNLVLSFQAAYTAPVIMMSQNRKADVDREKAEIDYRVNVKAELEIELLHQKIDMLREQEITKLTTIIEDLLRRMETTAPPAQTSQAERTGPVP